MTEISTLRRFRLFIPYVAEILKYCMTHCIMGRDRPPGSTTTVYQSVIYKKDIFIKIVVENWRNKSKPLSRSDYEFLQSLKTRYISIAHKMQETTTNRRGPQFTYTARIPKQMQKFICRKMLVSQEFLKTNLVLQIVLASISTKLLRNGHVHSQKSYAHKNTKSC